MKFKFYSSNKNDFFQLQRLTDVHFCYVTCVTGLLKILPAGNETLKANNLSLRKNDM